MKQRHAFANLLYHLTFKVSRRQQLISSLERERFLVKLIVSKSHELDVYLYACGAADDHAHVLFSARPSLAIEKYIHDIKGLTAWVWNKEKKDGWGHLAWQDGYWVQTVTPAGFEALKSYVANQREHHCRGEVNTTWEMPAN
jgi:REP element-mobilizing transposase RayT